MRGGDREPRRDARRSAAATARERAIALPLVRVRDAGALDLFDLDSELGIIDGTGREEEQGGELHREGSPRSPTFVTWFSACSADVCLVNERSFIQCQPPPDASSPTRRSASSRTPRSRCSSSAGSTRSGYVTSRPRPRSRWGTSTTT